MLVVEARSSGWREAIYRSLKERERERERASFSLRFFELLTQFVFISFSLFPPFLLISCKHMHARSGRTHIFYVFRFKFFTLKQKIYFTIDEFGTVLGGQPMPFCFYPLSMVTRNCKTRRHQQLRIYSTVGCRRTWGRRSQPRSFLFFTTPANLVLIFQSVFESRWLACSAHRVGDDACRARNAAEMFQTVEVESFRSQQCCRRSRLHSKRCLGVVRLFLQPGDVLIFR